MATYFPETIELALAQDLLRSSGGLRVAVRGASMLPWVRPGDTVDVRSVQPEAVRCGDLVLFARHGVLITHRVIEKRGLAGDLRLIAKGDSRVESDGVIRRDELLGRVVRIHRGKRRMDLDGPWESFKSSLIARVSGRGHSWHAVGRLAAMAMSPLRRLAAFFE
jgi:signal peptidase I